MQDKNSVIKIKDYGRISFRFNEVMDAKKISRNKLATLTGMRFEVTDRLYKGKVERMDMDVLARVCYVLNCQVEDVIKYQVD